MNWFLYALAMPALSAVSNHIDKYLISKYFKGGGVGALMIFSSIIGLFLLPIIALFHPETITSFEPKYILIAFNGSIFVLAILPYFYALQRDEATIAVPLLQLAPVISYVLSYFVLGEVLTQIQILGGIIIIIGAILIALELKHKKGIRFKRDVFVLMSISSFLYALNLLLFKYFALKNSFWVTSFWEYVGFALLAFLLLIFVKPYRKEFMSILKRNRIAVLSLNAFNEIIYVIGKIAFNFASLLAPLTLVLLVNSLQPLFVFVYGIILTVAFPKISQEDISRRTLTQKVVAIAIMLVGTYLINQT